MLGRMMTHRKQSKDPDSAGVKDFDQTERKRPRYQFRLWVLLVFVLVAGIVSGLVGRRLIEIRRQRNAVDELIASGGRVSWGYGGLPKSLGLSDTQVTDADLVYLKELANLRSLYLSNTRVTDAGLEHLSGMPNLKILDLLFTQVTDAGVKKLEEALPNCHVIHRFDRPSPTTEP